MRVYVYVYICCMLHLAAGATVIFIVVFFGRYLVLDLLFVKENFFTDVPEVILTDFENKKPPKNVNFLS